MFKDRVQTCSKNKQKTNIWGNKKRDGCDKFLPEFGRAGIQR